MIFVWDRGQAGAPGGQEANLKVNGFSFHVYKYLAFSSDTLSEPNKIGMP